MGRREVEVPDEPKDEPSGIPVDAAKLAPMLRQRLRQTIAEKEEVEYQNMLLQLVVEDLQEQVAQMMTRITELESGHGH